MLPFLSFTCLFSLFLLSPPTTLTLHNVCPGREHQITSPSLLHHPKKQGLAAVDPTGRRGLSSQEKRKSRSRGGKRDKGTGRRSRSRTRRTQSSSGGAQPRLQSPMSDQTERYREAKDRRRRKKASQSLPRDTLRNSDDGDTERKAVRRRKSGKDRGRSRGRERKSRSKERERISEGEESEKEDEQERMEERVENVSEDSDEEVFLPIPSPIQRLPRPKQIWEEESEDKWDMAADYRELRKERKPGIKQERSRSEDSRENADKRLNEYERGDDNEQSSSFKPSLLSAGVTDAASQRKSFSFLISTLSVDQLGDNESESEGSYSDGSESAASISVLSLATTKAGPWLTPSQQRLTQVVKENGQHGGGWTGHGGRRSDASSLFNRKMSSQ